MLYTLRCTVHILFKKEVNVKFVFTVRRLTQKHGYLPFKQQPRLLEGKNLITFGIRFLREP